MASKTEICNLALSHLGTGKAISNVDTEKSAEANACKVFFHRARNSCLREFQWPFATAFATLGLVAMNPTTEWGYSYRYPTDCLEFRRIVSKRRTDTHQSRIPYKIGGDSQGKLIYCDIESAQCEYTMKLENVDAYPDDFQMALSLRLANYIAPRITGGDPFKMGQRALQLYQFELSRAEVSAGNEEQPDQTPEAESIRARD